MDGKSRFSRGLITLVLGFCVCGWMFFLGILVGRGTAPVSFDTRSFQASLAKLAHDFEGEEKTFERPVLDFYEGLKSAMLSTTGKAQEEKELSQAKNLTQGERVAQGEILPVTADAHGDGKGSPLLKKSLKGLTLKSKSVAARSRDDLPPDISPEASPDPLPYVERSVVKKEKKILEPDVENGEYTIQVAAYRNLADAVGEIERLKTRGITSYRTMGRVGNDVWHRVRTGSFKDMESAQKRLGVLAGLGVKGIILNKEE